MILEWVIFYNFKELSNLFWLWLEILKEQIQINPKILFLLKLWKILIFLNSYTKIFSYLMPLYKIYSQE